MWVVVVGYDRWWDDGVTAVYGPFKSKKAAEKFEAESVDTDLVSAVFKLEAP